MCFLLQPKKKCLLEGKDYLELKKKLREQQRFLKSIPRVTLKEGGALASLEQDLSQRIPIFLHDVQNLIIFSQTSHTFYNPRW